MAKPGLTPMCTDSRACAINKLCHINETQSLNKERKHISVFNLPTSNLWLKNKFITWISLKLKVKDSQNNLELLWPTNI